MSATTGRRSATLVASAGVQHAPASLRAEPGVLALGDGARATRTLVVDRDVDALALHRVITADRSARVLDLVRDGRAVLRLGEAWRLDDRRGVEAVAAAAGLPLVRRAPEGDGRAVAPGGSPVWLLTLVAASYLLALVLTAHLVLGRRPADLLLAAASVAATGALVGWRARVRAARGTVLFRACPGTPVPRSFAAGAVVTRVGGLVTVSNGTRTRWVVPVADDRLGPRELRPGRLADRRQGPEKRLALVGDDDRVVLHLGRAEWCADGSERDLAAAFGVPWVDTPAPRLDMVRDRGVTTAGLSVQDPQPLLVPGLVAWWVALWSLSGEGPLAVVATVTGVVGVAAGPAVFFGLLVRGTLGRREVRPATTAQRARR